MNKEEQFLRKKLAEKFGTDINSSAIDSLLEGGMAKDNLLWLKEYHLEQAEELLKGFGEELNEWGYSISTRVLNRTIEDYLIKINGGN